MDTLICIHLGLGDLINYVPAIRLLSESDKIILPCYEKYISNAKQMLAGMNVSLLSIPDDAPYRVEELMKEYRIKGDKVIGLGYYSDEPLDVNGHIRQGYRKLEIGYRYALKKKVLEKQANKVRQVLVPLEPYNLIIEEGSDGNHYINRKYIAPRLELKPPKECLLLSFADTIYHAEETHCIDTSWLWLVNSLPTKGKLFFHRYARNNGHDYSDMFFKDWTILES